MLKVFGTSEPGRNLFGTGVVETNPLRINRGLIGEFKTYEEFSKFIMKKSLFWGFFLPSPLCVKKICRLKMPEYITLSETIALEKGCGLIEMRRGDNVPLRKIVATPEVDVGMLLKNWCREYSEAQRYNIFEISLFVDSPSRFNSPQQDFSCNILPLNEG